MSLWLIISLLISSAQAEVTDRLLAIVNGQAVTDSDVVWALALDPDLQPLELSAANRRAMLERVIDQRLLAQEAEKTPQNEPREEEVTSYIAEKIIKPFGSEQKLRERLQKVGLDQASLREIARFRLGIERYVNFRFRSFAFVRPEEVERYYNDVDLPLMRQAGKVQTLEERREAIETILEGRRINAELDRFFDEARTQAQIIRLVEL